ncbi:hypothetical protein [Vibrio lentus]|uniref:baseplate complex protein n=1 Tax=Vibrio lentus TaxID=136468 RepID=UPI001F52B559|nr:hypothetical protein [Vibrio lentus]
MLALDGVPVNLDSMKVEMSMELKDQDMSGQSSGTDTAEQGDKGKKLTFSGRVPFTRVERSPSCIRLHWTKTAPTPAAFTELVTTLRWHSRFAM